MFADGGEFVGAEVDGVDCDVEIEDVVDVVWVVADVVVVGLLVVVP